MNDRKPVHLVMPHYNGKNDVFRAYMSIMERTRYPFILTIIDDGSKHDDPGYQFLKGMVDANQFPENVSVIFNDVNVGVTKNLNKGFNKYPTLDVVRLDADIEIQSSMWLNDLVKFAYSSPKIGVVAPIGLEADFVTIQTAGQWLVVDPKENAPTFNYEIFDKMGQPRWVVDKPLEVDSCLGCCAFFKREVIDAIGGVDEGYFGWVEDNDMCIAARSKGYSCWILPDISYCHHHHAPKRSSEERNKILEDSENLFIKKWGFSLYAPTHYFDEIKKRYEGTEIFWRYNNHG